MATEIVACQRLSGRIYPQAKVARARFAKTILCTDNAFLAIDRLIPSDLMVAHFRPGATIPLALRFSNASEAVHADGLPDMRGLAVRLRLPGERHHDLLLANRPAALVRDARQLLAFTLASLGDRETFLVRLAERLGHAEAQRIAQTTRRSLRVCSSLADECFWSRSANLWGEAPVRFRFRPTGCSIPSFAVAKDADFLGHDLARRLAEGEVAYRFAVQRYVDAHRTPVEDASVEWDDRAAPPIEIATLIVPRQDVAAPRQAAASREIERWAFDPWHAQPEFRPLGSLNRLLKFVYTLSAKLRGID